MRVSNKNAGRYVDRMSEFTGSNTFAVWEHGVYVVYSYGRHFPMYAYMTGQWFGNGSRYSQTTSCHQSQLRPSGNIVYYPTTDEFRRGIEKTQQQARVA